eukprot:GAHX01001301.1.p1 GENE.GAHX01001301.1~~GAHX01001301.1.p1  ORF type:complete len:383 (-),score=108.20 GAHX01001301.1:54-1169(-)
MDEHHFKDKEAKRIQIDSGKLLDAFIDQAREMVTSGVSTLEAAKKVQTHITEALEKVDLKKKPFSLSKKYKNLILTDGDKGTYLPVTISVNNDLLSANSSVVIKDGDLVKIGLSLHLDGLHSHSAHSFVMNSDASLLLTATKKVISELVAFITPGKTHEEITEFIKKTTEEESMKIGSELNFIDGLLMHQVKKFIRDSNTFIKCPFKKFSINAKGETVSEWNDDKMENWEVEEGMVLELHIVSYLIEDLKKTKEFADFEEGRNKHLNVVKFSPGKIYARNFKESEPGLTLKCAKTLLKRIERNYGAFFFNEEDLESERGAKMAINLMTKNGLLINIEDAKLPEGVNVCELKVTIGIEKEGNIVVSGRSVLE